MKCDVCVLSKTWLRERGRKKCEYAYFISHLICRTRHSTNRERKRERKREGGGREGGQREREGEGGGQREREGGGREVKA